MFAEIQKTTDVYENDYTFVSSLYVDGEDLLSTPAVRMLKSHTYVSSGGMQDSHHPYSYAVKPQANKHDNPTYNYILKVSPK